MPPHVEASAATERRRGLDFVFAFVCVFAGLLVPSRGIGPLYVRAHVALASLWLPEQPLESGVKLTLSASASQLADAPWQALLIATPAHGTPVLVPVDLRVLLFLPSAAFVALAVATPFGAWRRNAKLLLVGMALLEPLLLCLLSAPLLSFLGGTGPITAFQLSRATHTVLQLIYRALVAPPGMAFALPLLLWWLLLNAMGGLSPSENRSTAFDFRSLLGRRARKAE